MAGLRSQVAVQPFVGLPMGSMNCDRGSLLDGLLARRGIGPTGSGETQHPLRLTTRASSKSQALIRSVKSIASPWQGYVAESSYREPSFEVKLKQPKGAAINAR